MHAEDDMKTPGQHHLQAKEEGSRPPEAGRGLGQMLPHGPQKEQTPLNL